SSRCTSEASGADRSSTSSSARRPARSGSGTDSSWSSRPGRRSSGETPSGRADVHTTATPGAPTARPTTSSSTVATGFASSRGASASTSSSSSTAGVDRLASASASRSAAAAADASSAAIPGAQRRTTVAPTAAATDRTSVVLPDPAGPVTRIPSCGVVPSRASTSVWWKPRSSHSRSCPAWDCKPGRSSIAGTGSSSGPVAPPRASAGAVATIGVALPVVAAPSRQPTTVPIVTSAGPSGSVPVTVSSVVVARDDLAEQRLAQHGRPDRRHRLGGPGHDDPARLPQGCRRDRDLVAVPDAEVAEQQVVAQRLAAGTVGDRGDGAGGAGAGQPDRVPRCQAERGEHLPVQPYDAATGVEPGPGEPGGQRQCVPVRPWFRHPGSLG